MQQSGHSPQHQKRKGSERANVVRFTPESGQRATCRHVRFVPKADKRRGRDLIYVKADFGAPVINRSGYSVPCDLRNDVRDGESN